MHHHTGPASGIMAGLLSGSFTDRKHVDHGCSMIDPDYTPIYHIRSAFAPCGICLVCCTRRTHPKSLGINAEVGGSGDLQ
ncbi:hypothetical protein TNCV_4145331 [Trichonephila clavipes]|nr:hypothetical protein TNCV_4145331 [Trichonephila clavipes]